MLAAAGLMQHVQAAGGSVRIVYLTNGEGYPAGVRAEEHRHANPTAADYRGYGRRRQHEAKAAAEVVGLEPGSLTFLGFPNNGLSRLMTGYWSDRRAAYRSPYTRLDRPPKSDILEPETEYRGEDLTQELAEIIGTFKPTIVVAPRRQDQHVDHCAAWYFTADALGDVERVLPAYRPDLLTYIVHYNSWPFDDEEPPLQPPSGLSSGISGWLTVPLTPDEVATKWKALRKYRSQMDVMDWFLKGFARTNEIFSRPRPPHVVLPVRRSYCDQFIETALSP